MLFFFSSWADNSVNRVLNNLKQYLHGIALPEFLGWSAKFRYFQASWSVWHL